MDPRSPATIANRYEGFLWESLFFTLSSKEKFFTFSKENSRKEKFFTLSGGLLLYMCPHPTIYVSSYSYAQWRPTAIYVSTSCYICVRLLLRSLVAYCYICVLILLYMCPPTAMYVRILLLSLYVKVSCEDRATR